MNAGNKNLGIALAIIVLSIGLIAFGRGTGLTPGAEFRVDVTIVPADVANLDCDSAASLDGYMCAFDSNRRVLDDERALRPFVSTNRELVLLSGLFRTPSVMEWLGTAKTDQRAQISCRVRYLGILPGVGVRFNGDAPFESHRKVPAARASACDVLR